jgi:UDP-N-acetylglucosamine 2-epimerase
VNFIPSSSQSSTNLEIVTIAGNRPEIIKLSELVKSLGGTYKNAFVYTGQHFSPNMRDIFFDELNVKIDYDRPVILSCEFHSLRLSIMLIILSKLLTKIGEIIVKT